MKLGLRSIENTTHRIKFLDLGTTDDHGITITYRTAKAFDVEEGETKKQYLIAFEDGNQILRFFGETVGFEKIKQVINKSTFSSLHDIMIYQTQKEDDSNNGNAFMYTDNGVYFITYDFMDTTCSESEIEDGDGTSLFVDKNHPISISNLKSVVVDSDGTYAYALADDVISVIKLSSKTIESTIALKDVIGRDVAIESSALVYTSFGGKNYLLATSDALQSTIVVDLSGE